MTIRPFAASDRDADSGLERISEPWETLDGPFRRLPRSPRRARRTPSMATISSTARTLSPSATMRWASRSCSRRRRVGQVEQRAGVARRQDARRDPPLHRRREPQETNRVRDLRTRSPDPGGQLLLGAAEVLQHLLVGRSLLQRVQLSPVQVLQEGVPQHVVRLRLPDDRRDRREAGRLGGPEPPLPHHELEPDVPLGRMQWPDDHRLQQPHLGDRLDQLVQFVLVEHLARLRGSGGSPPRRSPRSTRLRGPDR